MDPNLEVTINRSQDTVAHSFTPRGGKRSFLRSRRQEWHDFQDYWSDSIAASSWTNARSTFDAWLIAAAAQVGQVILTLPTTFAQMGYASGILFMLIYASMGCWSVFLLTWLYFQVIATVENRLRTAGTRLFPENHILQYHEVMTQAAGVWYGRVTLIFNIGSLFLASVIQLVASASNLYYANSNINKQKWTLVVGSLTLLISVGLPSYRHYRIGAVLAVLGTTVVAVYMTAAALKHGQVGNVVHTAPTSGVKFFTGATNILFMFGGHGVTIEIMEGMQFPRRFKYIYVLVVCYTLSLTLPSAISVYWAFGDTLLSNSNAIAVLPRSSWRTLALTAITVHQLTAFVVFIQPVYYVAEKAVRVHTRQMWRRILVRLPVFGTVWFLAIAIPFFGPLNSMMGAFLVSVVVYILPAAVFIRIFSHHQARQNSVLHIPERFEKAIWKTIFTFNAFIVAWVLVVGVILGAWASVTTFVREINEFGLFAKCYQCPVHS